MPDRPEPTDAELDQHLSQMPTTWKTVAEAHGGATSVALAARQRLLERYQRAVYRYLMASVRDRDAADELFQEFALRLVRGDFKRADPEKGRFRDFLKTALYHLVVDDRRRRQRPLEPLGPDTPEPAVAPDAEADRQFVALWRAELMNRTWEALAQAEQLSGEPLHAVLRYRFEHPEARSPEMARALAGLLGKPVTPGWVRKRLFLARKKFKELLRDEVTRSLGDPTPEELEQELIDLGLWEYCRPTDEGDGA